jgi:uncharacterized damage-inducible protein DinB
MQPQPQTGRPLSLDVLRTMYDHAIWARDRLLPLIESLEQEQLTVSEQKGVYGSIHDTLAHMAASEWMWLQRCQGESPMRIPKGEDFRDLQNIVVWWNEVHAQVDQYLSSISRESLNTEVTYLGPDGKRRTRKVWHMLLQVPIHQTDHRSQIATILGSMGLDVPQTDLVVFLSERTA